MTSFKYNDLPEAGDRFVLEETLGEGVHGRVFCAKDTHAGNRKVAIKIQKYSKENELFVHQEYWVLNNLQHPNVPEFYGAYKSVEGDPEVWFVMEVCEGGPVIDLVRGLTANNRRMSEEHIAFIVKEVVKALVFFHRNSIIHRDVRASNIILTKDGEVKLIDFGLSYRLSSPQGTTSALIGSPYWMAPEIMPSAEDMYDNRVDVWSLGITAIELGEGKSPFETMHPSRAMFLVARNPPPTLYRPANWSVNYNDFISECLVKNPEYRPVAEEILEHPFLTEVPEKNYHLSQELKALFEIWSPLGKQKRTPETVVVGSFLKESTDQPPKRMVVEDLAALPVLTEDAILRELKARMANGNFHTFLGDILLVLNPNETQDIYGEKYHQMYQMKSRVDNAPHIYAVADDAYQSAIHHESAQHILLAGESGSGKTTNYHHIIDHLLFLGQNENINQDRIKHAVTLIHAFTHAATPINSSSTRCVLKTDLAFAATGRNTAATFRVFLNEKNRVASQKRQGSNFHIFSIVYEGLSKNGELNKYLLNPDRNHRILGSSPIGADSNQLENFKSYFQEYEFSNEQVESVLSIVAAVLNLGDIHFQDGDSNAFADISNKTSVKNVAELLRISEEKLVWALTNFCFVNKGEAMRMKQTVEEAQNARNVLVNNLYSRLVDYLISVINHKLAYGKAIFGEKYTVKVTDLSGFECFKKNDLSQFLVNCLNEQLQYLYLQRIFAWEALEMNEDDITYTPIPYYNNKTALDQMLSKSDGVLALIDEATKTHQSGKYVTDSLQNKSLKYVKTETRSEFSVNHYTGQVTYDVKDMPEKNRDFLPPELIDTFRLSDNPIVRALFMNKLDKFGNLNVQVDNEKATEDESSKGDQYSQTKKTRTSARTYKAFCLDLLRELSVGGGTGGIHFVRCLRTDLKGLPRGFNNELVNQQLKAMAVLETAKARQRGYPHRIQFPEFLRRYKFLAFDFDETVEITKDNCRLLLVRLKMEGFLIGKSKVFLKYYNEEYLSRLYESQVKKVIKVQSMIRAYIARRQASKRLKTESNEKPTSSKHVTMEIEVKENAALVVQKAYRNYIVRKGLGKITVDDENMDEDAQTFIRYYCYKWKARSMYQTLLQYRAARFQDLFNFSQQVHLYNQKSMNGLQKGEAGVDLNRVDTKAKPINWLGPRKAAVLKLPFRLSDVTYFDSNSLRDPFAVSGIPDGMEETWDAPFRWRTNVSQAAVSCSKPLNPGGSDEKLIDVPYSRDPALPIAALQSTSKLRPSDSVSPRHQLKPLQSRVASPLQPIAPIPSLRKVQTLKEEEVSNETSKPANKDFEFIKLAPLKQRGSVNPILELQNRGRRSSGATEDDPPFNFQAMLRKTNYNRDSIKRADKSLRRFSLAKTESAYETEDDQRSLRGGLSKSVDSIYEKKVIEELFPGVVLEGIEIDL